MGDLRVMGAKRIEALTKVLNHKRTQDKVRLLPKAATHEDVLEALEARTFLNVRSFVKALESIGAEIRWSWNYSKPTPPYYEAKEILEVGRKTMEKHIDAYYEGLINQLWLCETIAEAKLLVDGAGYVPEVSE